MPFPHSAYYFLTPHPFLLYGLSATSVSFKFPFYFYPCIKDHLKYHLLPEAFADPSLHFQHPVGMRASFLDSLNLLPCVVFN